jgi:hypothetical protein
VCSYVSDPPKLKGGQNLCNIFCRIKKSFETVPLTVVIVVYVKIKKNKEITEIYVDEIFDFSN